MKRWMVAIGAGLWISALAPGLSVTAQAEWVEEDGESYFLDSSGNRVKSDWRTRDGISYYLDSEGNVATDTWIQNTYYVDAQGAMVKDSWVEEDGESGLKEAGWYYLGQNGKVEKDTWKTIENFRYSFDSDGKMRTGWHYEDGEVYYLGDPDEGLPGPAGSFWSTASGTSRRRGEFPASFRKGMQEGDGSISRKPERRNDRRRDPMRRRPLTGAGIILTQMG